MSNYIFQNPKYASHEKYGESIRISSKEFDPDKVIELKFFRNTPSVKLTDFSHRTPDGKFQSQFLNTANDIVQNINSPLIQEAAAQFREISPERLEQARQQNAPVVQNETIRQNTAPVQTAPVPDAPEKRIEMLAESIVQKIITGLKEEIAKNPDIARNQEVQVAVNLVADRLENIQGIQPNVAVANEQYDIATPLKQFAIECNHSFQENMSYGMNENGEMLERPDSKAVYQNRDGNETVFLVSEGYSAVVKIAEQNGKISATAIDRAEQWNVPIDDIDILTSLVDGGNISVEVAEVTAKVTGLTNEERAKYHDEYQKF
ncbi:MAG: hypothetical protein V3G42_10440 [Oscillospiraceae bacterium]